SPAEYPQRRPALTAVGPARSTLTRERRQQRVAACVSLRHPRKPVASSDAAVAMLEFLARTAGTSGIARRPGPRRTDSCRGPLPCPFSPAILMIIAAPLTRASSARRHRAAIPGSRRGRVGKRHLVLERRRFAEHHFAIGWLRRRRRLHAQFDVAQYRGHLLAQIDQHLFKEFERLAFVFVERVALGIGPQV